MANANPPPKLELKTYGTMRFAVPEGVYTLEELEKLLAHCREMKERSDESLRKSMGLTK